MSNKTYVGNCKTQEGQFGKWLSVGLTKDDLDTMAANLNDKGWVNLSISKRREVGQYGDTHSIVVQEPQAAQAPQYNDDPM